MRPIDADAMKSYIDCGHLRPPTEVCFSDLDVVRMLDRMPTIDAVEVVRCKDCKHRGIAGECPMCYTEDSYDEDYGYDYWDVDKTTDDGFCHCGEKWDEEVQE